MVEETIRTIKETENEAEDIIKKADAAYTEILEKARAEAAEMVSKAEAEAKAQAAAELDAAKEAGRNSDQSGEIPVGFRPVSESGDCGNGGFFRSVLFQQAV